MRSPDFVQGMPLMGRTNVPNALEKPSHFNNLSVEGQALMLAYWITAGVHTVKVKENEWT